MAGTAAPKCALAQGLPMIVAGDREDKPEVAARVAWTGAGINLRTGTPTPRQIRKAVKDVVADPSHREAAGRLAEEFHNTKHCRRSPANSRPRRPDPHRAAQGPLSAPLCRAHQVPTTMTGPDRQAAEKASSCSTIQLALGIAGLRRALKERRVCDIGFLRGSAEAIELQHWLLGTNLSAPGVMLVLQAVCTGALFRNPRHPRCHHDRWVPCRTISASQLERPRRRHCTPHGSGKHLAALMAIQGLRQAEPTAEPLR
jgi:hypothetical protein